MTTPYRSELDALRERKDSLEREIAQLKAQTVELEELRSREQALERELAQVSQRLGGGARRALPMLDQLKVASPCNARWDEMLGDERVRFCMSCEKHVYNISAMPREEAERLLAERLGKDLCVRFYRRADGTVMTEDCPVGVKKQRRKKLAVAVAGVGAMTLAAASYAREACTTMGAPVQGAIAVVPTATEAVMGEVVEMGGKVETPPPSAPSGSAAHGDTRVLMGKRSP
ncbi:MAG TPA: hypothetical protein VM580_01595 [Labilithrix sp.]|nr:hypothetical protein [Labilithrix sp.]